IDFFFQAEDGIRDRNVTGVQTCALPILKNANKARKEPLRVILNGLGKDAAQIISRINGFTYVQTQFDYATGKVNIVREIRYSERSEERRVGKEGRARMRKKYRKKKK